MSLIQGPYFGAAPFLHNTLKLGYETGNIGQVGRQY